jgi:hypothetical protein
MHDWPSWWVVVAFLLPDGTLPAARYCRGLVNEEDYTFDGKSFLAEEWMKLYSHDIASYLSL